jgi:hypothetical protein
VSKGRFLSWVVFGAVAVLVAVLAAACAGNETTPTPAADSGLPSYDGMSFVPDSGNPYNVMDSTTPPEDSTVPLQDSSVNFGDTNIDFGDTAVTPFDAGTPPPGVSVATGTDLRLWGVTDDGYAIYSTAEPGGSLFAVQLPTSVSADGGSDAGHDAASSHDASSDGNASDGNASGDGSTGDGGTPGAPISIAPVDASAIVIVEHDVVLAWSGFNFISGVGSLVMWTSAGGMHMLSTASVPGSMNITPFGTTLMTSPTQPAISAGVSADSSYVLFLDNADPENSGTADVYQAATSTGTKAAVQMGISISFAYPSLGFAGDPPNPISAVVAASAAGIEYGIRTFSVPSWTASQTIPATTTWVWSSNSAGTKLLAFPSAVDGGAGGAVVFPLEPDGGSPTPIDPTGQFGTMTPDGTHVIYGGSAGGLSISPTTSASPSVLVTPPASPIEGILALAPSAESVLFYETEDSSDDGATDLYAASATASGPITTLSSATTAGLVSPGDAFTADSSHALYFTDYTPPNPPFQTGPTNGTYTAAVTGSDGGAALALGQKAVMGWATSGAKVVFTANLATATADLEAIDLSSATMPTTLVPSVSPYVFLSPSKTLIVYSWNVSPTIAGIYVMPAP